MSGVGTENFVYSGRLDPRIESPVVFTGVREGHVDYIGDVDTRHVRPPIPVHNSFILVLTHLGITNNLLYPIKYRKEMWIDEERLQGPRPVDLFLRVTFSGSWSSMTYF